MDGVLSGDEFVHVTPRRFAPSIQKCGLDPSRVGGMIYLTRLRWVMGKSASQLEDALYRKDLRAMKQGVLSRGGFAVVVVVALPPGARPGYHGMTTRPGGVPQWTYAGPPIQRVRII